MSKKFIFITGILSLIGCGLEIGISWISWLIGWSLDIVIIAFLITLFGAFFRKEKKTFHLYFKRNMLFCGSVLWFFSLVLLVFSFFFNTFPSALSEIHLSDGKRNIVFLQMSHIGSPSYYVDVRQSLQRLTLSGYTLYREWVRPGTQENQDRFDRALGVKISTGTYADFASWMGLISQDDGIFSGIASASIVWVDLSIDDIVGLMGTGTQSHSQTPVDPMRELSILRDSGTWPFLPYLMRWFLNLSLRYDSASDVMLDQMDGTLRSALIEKRNLHVVDTALSDSHQNIVIIYGALHFEGIYALLRARDSRWHIVSMRALYPYKL
jgi:hypothetical protein